MHIHILGICGTFMGGIAVLARQLGYEVSGSDANVYPPMSEQLEAQDIRLSEGYDPAHLASEPDLVVIGNALSRGNPLVEYVLDRGLPYTSGPAFLADNILRQRWVLAVSGTHGKTTTASMLAWILEEAGMMPGYLIGGVSLNFPATACLGKAPFFVVEADEYDSAFFDKRSKFIHYRARTLIMNNLEYDHADIFDDLAAIQRQFHHLVRTVPASGLIILPDNDDHLDAVLQQGCWTPVEHTSQDRSTNSWHARNISKDLQNFDVYLGDECIGPVAWSQMGHHNISNALAAVAAARHAGVLPAQAVAALNTFQGVKRRMELRAIVDQVTIYDDFAHHPSAIALTLEGLRNNVGDAHITAILELRSNTMRMGIHKDALPRALEYADEVILYQSEQLDFDLQKVASSIGTQGRVMTDIAAIIKHVAKKARPGEQVLIMSNGGFDNIHQRLIEALRHRES